MLFLLKHNDTIILPNTHTSIHIFQERMSNDYCCVYFFVLEWESDEVWLPAERANIPTPDQMYTLFRPKQKGYSNISTPLSLVDCCINNERWINDDHCVFFFLLADAWCSDIFFACTNDVYTFGR